MAGERLDLAVKQLAALTGQQNVAEAGGTVLVKPSCSAEVAGIMEIAHKAGIPVQVPKYFIGPAQPRKEGPGIVVSLERMSKITVDRGRHYMLTGPAAGAGAVLEAAREHGAVFPGGDCLHQGETIGEKIVDCFEEGEPHFKCREACLCGLEMVLADGRQVAVGESGIKDLDNYHLSFILSGYRESAAVLTGLLLKMVPAPKSFSLVAVPVELSRAVAGLPLLLESIPSGLLEVFIINHAFCHNAPGGYRFRGLGQEDACLVIRTEGDHPALELIMDMISRHCGPGEEADAYIAGDSYQRAVLDEALESLVVHFEESPDFSRQKIYESIGATELVEQLAALIWRKDGGLSGVFFSVKD